MQGKAALKAGLKGAPGGEAAVEPMSFGLDLQSAYGNRAVADRLAQNGKQPAPFDFSMVVWDLQPEGIQGPLPAGTVRQEGKLLIQQTDDGNVLIEYGDASLRIASGSEGKYSYFIDPAVKKSEPQPLGFLLGDEAEEAPLPQIKIRVASNQNVRVDWNPGAMLNGMPLVVHSRVTGDLETAPGLIGSDVSEFGILESGIKLTLDNTFVHLLGTTPEARAAYWFEPEYSGPAGLERVVHIVASAGVRVRTGTPDWPSERRYGRELIPQVIRVPHPAMVPEQGEPIDPSDFIGVQNLTDQPSNPEVVITSKGVEIVENPDLANAYERLLQFAQGSNGTSIVHPESGTRISLRPANPEIGATYAWQLIPPTHETTGEIRIVVGPGTIVESASPPPASYARQQRGYDQMQLPGSSAAAPEIPKTPQETLRDSRVDLRIVEVRDPTKVPAPGTPINLDYYLAWGSERQPDIHTWLETSNTAFDIATGTLDVGVGMIPIVGDLVDIGEFIYALATDKDRWGRKVDAVDKVLMGLGAVIGLIPFLGGAGSLFRGAKKATHTLSTVAQAWGKTDEQLEVIVHQVAKVAKGEDSVVVNRVLQGMRTGDELDPRDIERLQSVLNNVGAGAQRLAQTTRIKALQFGSYIDEAGAPVTDIKLMSHMISKIDETGEISPAMVVSLERSGVAQNADEAKAVAEQTLRDAAKYGGADPSKVDTAIGQLDELISDDTFNPVRRMGTVTDSDLMKNYREHRQWNPVVEHRRGGIVPAEDLEPNQGLARRMEQGERNLDESFNSINNSDIERSKAFAASDQGATVSGYTFVPEREVLNVTPANVRARGTQLGHPVRGHRNDRGIRGQYFASHAEKKQIIANPDRPVGVSRPMCYDCFEFFSREARARGAAQVVTDPFTTRVFHPSGQVTEYWRDGSVVRIHPDGTATTLPSTMRAGATP